MRLCRRTPLGCAIAGLLAILAGPALAHPHVWVEARAKVVFGKDGKVDAIRNDWVFDEMYSAFAVTGLEKNGKLATSADLATLGQVERRRPEGIRLFHLCEGGRAEG